MGARREVLTPAAVRSIVLCFIPLIGALVGLAIAGALGAPRGAEHHCPPGSPPDLCSYPPDRFLWFSAWAIAGCLVGLVVVYVAVQVRRHRSG